MLDRADILRGDAWAARLQGHLSAPPDDILAWMAEHTHRLKNEKYLVSGLLRLGGDFCFLKFYGFRQPLARHALRFYTPPAIRAYETAAALRWKEVSVPRPRACLLIRRGILLLLKGIEASETLYYLYSGGLTYELASHIMSAAGDEIAKMHLSGYAHGDLRWNNLLWGRDKLYITHLEQVRRMRPQGKARWHDLASFTVGAEQLGLDALYFKQFLKAYMHRAEIDRDVLLNNLEGPLGRARKKHWARHGNYDERLV